MIERVAVRSSVSSAAPAGPGRSPRATRARGSARRRRPTPRSPGPTPNSCVLDDLLADQADDRRGNERDRQRVRSRRPSSLRSGDALDHRRRTGAGTARARRGSRPTGSRSRTTSSASPAVPESRQIRGSATSRAGDRSTRSGRYSVRPSTRPSTTAWPTPRRRCATTARTTCGERRAPPRAPARPPRRRHDRRDRRARSRGAEPRRARHRQHAISSVASSRVDEVGARVVLGVALALHVPEVHRRVAERERSPVPRAAVRARTR